MKNPPLRERIDQVFDAYQKDLPRCERELRCLLKKAEEATDLHSIGKCYLRLAMCNFRQGKRSNLLQCAYKAVCMFENTKEHQLLARSYNMLGIAYASQGGYQRAILEYQKALKTIHGKKKPGISKEALLNNIGDAYYHMRAFEKSLEIALDCYHNCREDTPNYHRVLTLYGMNIFDIYCGLNNLQKAKEFLDEVQPDSQLLNPSTVLCGYYTRRAYILYAFGDRVGGADFADRVIKMVQSGYDSYEIHSYFEKIANFLIKQGDHQRAQRFSDLLTSFSSDCGHTLDHIIAKRVQANISMASADRTRTLSLLRDLSKLYEQYRHEQAELQYECQKDIENASREIAKLLEQRHATMERSHIDPLTGLMNRGAMVNIVSDHIQNAKIHGKKLGAFFLDIDHFKEYNDTYGHAAGDAAIKFVAGICLDAETSTVKFFRYGGDEIFGIALGKSNNEIKKIAHRIAEKVQSAGLQHAKDPKGQKLTISIGVVNYAMKDSPYTILDFIKHADRALYQAKAVGKNGVCASWEDSSSPIALP